MNKGKQKIISLFVLIAIVIIIILCLISCQERKAQSESAMNDDTLTFETSKEEVEAIKEEVESKEERGKESSSVKVSSDSSASMDSSSSFTNNSTAGNSSTVNNSSTTNTSSANNEESTTGTSSDIDAEESTAAPVVESNNSNTSSSTPVNSSVPTNSSTSTNNSTPATESSTPATSTPATESSTQTNSSTPATESSSTATSTPATENSTATQPQSCNHAWGSRLVTIHHDATYAEEPIYGTKLGVVEEAWDEVVGYAVCYLTSDNVAFCASDYATLSDCEMALASYCGANGVSYRSSPIPIYEHHEAIYGDVPDYDNVVGYTKVEIVPAWDEEAWEYYCTKCGEILEIS